MLKIGRILARVFSVLCIGGGVGLLTWGITAAVMHERIAESIVVWGEPASASAVVGCGAGILAVGITTLILTFVDRNSYGSWD